MTNSRHNNISPVFIGHDANRCHRPESFQRTLLQNISSAFITLPTGVCKRDVKQVLTNIIDIDDKRIQEVIEISHYFSPFSYVFVNRNKMVHNDTMTRLQFRVFGENNENRVICLSNVKT